MVWSVAAINHSLWVVHRVSAPPIHSLQQTSKTHEIPPQDANSPTHRPFKSSTSAFSAEATAWAMSLSSTSFSSFMLALNAT